MQTVSGYEMIMCIIDSGFSETVMDAAKEVGARGGTVIHARGTANKEAEQFFNISIQPDKEIVMILVPSEIKDAVLHAIYRSAGLKTEGHGIAFSLPVDDVVGISSAPAHEPEKEEKGGEEKTESNEEAKTEN
ncbi:MAG: P-II family nitrogen regulator [Clostridia bacterium]|nr:P-II family nitrogen regulator [Clostridia bacterium]